MYYLKKTGIFHQTQLLVFVQTKNIYYIINKIIHDLASLHN